jgi:hypothetical protein
MTEFEISKRPHYIAGLMSEEKRYISPYFGFITLQTEWVVCQSGNLGIDEWIEDPATQPISY